MNATRFDTITRLLASRRLSRRQALTQGAGLAAGTLAVASLTPQTQAQEATPAATDEQVPVMLFLQAFRSGSITPADGTADRYTLTLEQGLGHTVYFSDRPDRIVGANPTPEFLENLGFPEDNPPNAALVVETEDGQTEVAVLELFSPSYDEPTHTATYEVAVLAEFERDNGFAETDANLAELLPRFGAAHLFIDGPVCTGRSRAYCHPNGDPNAVWIFSFDMGSGCCGSPLQGTCGACQGATTWTARCNQDVASCAGNCVATTRCG